MCDERGVQLCASMGMRMVLDQIAAVIESGQFDEADGAVMTLAVVVLDQWRHRPAEYVRFVDPWAEPEAVAL